MSYLKLMSEILEKDLCARCGACVAVCPGELLHLTEDSSPALRDGADPLVACGGCSLCTEVCPGKDPATAESEQRLFGRAREPSERWTGIGRGFHSVVCPDSQVRRHASAGGAGTALLLTALRTGLVDAAVVIGRDPEKPWRSKTIITSDEDTLIPSGQSSYCITPNLHELAASPYERLALVGLPCEIQALNKMRNLPAPPAVADKVVVTLELACSSSTRVEGTEHIVTELLDAELEDVTRLRYREGTYPGSFSVTLKDSTTRAIPFWKSVQTFSKFKTFRCRSCPDWWSGLADISICDGDPNIFRTSRAGEKSARCSMVVPRTRQGSELLRQAQALDLLLVKPAQFDQRGNMGLQRKRHRSQLLSERHGAGAVPIPSCAEPTPFRALTDARLMALLAPCASTREAARDTPSARHAGATPTRDASDVAAISHPARR